MWARDQGLFLRNGTGVCIVYVYGEYKGFCGVPIKGHLGPNMRNLREKTSAEPAPYVLQSLELRAPLQTRNFPDLAFGKLGMKEWILIVVSV